jgi:hypothetical protein
MCVSVRCCCVLAAFTVCSHSMSDTDTQTTFEDRMFSPAEHCYILQWQYIAAAISDCVSMTADSDRPSPSFLSSPPCVPLRFPWRLSPREEFLQRAESADHNRSPAASASDWVGDSRFFPSAKTFLVSSPCRLEQLILMKKTASVRAVTAAAGKAKTSTKMSACRSSEKGDAHHVRLVGNGIRDSRRYACLKCPYATDRRDLFTRHENIHRDEKPFRCYICNKMFNRADHVKKHFLRIHKGLEYDVKLTKRIKGIDYVDAENLPAETVVDSAQDISNLTNDPPTGSSSLHFSSHLVNRLIETNQLLNSRKSSHPAFPSALDAKNHLLQFHEISRPDNVPLTPSSFIQFDGDNISKRMPADTCNSEKTGPTIRKSETQSVVPSERNDRVSVETDLLDAVRDQISETRDDETSSISTAPSPTHSLSSRCSQHESQSQCVRCTIFPAGSRSIETVSRGLVMKQSNDDPGIFSNNQMTKSTSASSTRSTVHMSNEHECEVCGCAFADFPSLHTHRYLLHRFVSCSRRNPHLPQFLCASCGHYLPNQKSMMQHMAKHYVRGHADDGEEDGTYARICVASNRRKQFKPRKVVKSDISHSSL